MNVFLNLAAGSMPSQGQAHQQEKPERIAPFEVDTGPPVHGAPPSPPGQGSVQKEVIATEPKPQAEILDLLDEILSIAQECSCVDGAPEGAHGRKETADLAVRIGEAKENLDLTDAKGLLAALGITVPVEIRPADLRDLRRDIAEKIVTADIPRNLKGLLYGLLTHKNLSVSEPPPQEETFAVMSDQSSDEGRTASMKPVSVDSLVKGFEMNVNNDERQPMADAETTRPVYSGGEVRIVPIHDVQRDTEGKVVNNNLAKGETSIETQGTMHGPVVRPSIMSENATTEQLHLESLGVDRKIVVNVPLQTEAAAHSKESDHVARLLNEMRVALVETKPIRPELVVDQGATQEENPPSATFDPARPFVKKEVSVSSGEVEPMPTPNNQSSVSPKAGIESQGDRPNRSSETLATRAGESTVFTHPVRIQDAPSPRQIDSQAKVETGPEALQAKPNEVRQASIDDRKPSEPADADQPAVRLGKKESPEPRPFFIADDSVDLTNDNQKANVDHNVEGPRIIAPSSNASPVAHARITGLRSEREIAREHMNTIRDTVIEAIQELASSRGNGRTVIRLSPDDLGSVTVEVNSYGHNVEAKVTASDDRVRNALSHNRQELVQGVEGRGLQLDGFSVGKESNDPYGTGRGQNHGHSFSNRQDFERAAAMSGHRIASPTVAIESRNDSRFRKSGLDTLA